MWLIRCLHFETDGNYSIIQWDLDLLSVRVLKFECTTNACILCHLILSSYFNSILFRHSCIASHRCLTLTPYQIFFIQNFLYLLNSYNNQFPMNSHFYGESVVSLTSGRDKGLQGCAHLFEWVHFITTLKNLRRNSHQAWSIGINEQLNIISWSNWLKYAVIDFC